MSVQCVITHGKTIKTDNVGKDTLMESIMGFGKLAEIAGNTLFYVPSNRKSEEINHTISFFTGLETRGEAMIVALSDPFTPVDIDEEVIRAILDKPKPEDNQPQ